MGDLSPYLEDEFNESMRQGPKPSPDTIELTEEEKNRVFFDFTKFPEFIGAFEGPGQTYTWKNAEIKTWSFKDSNGLPWLIPQWNTMNEAQGNFKGFAEEKPGEYIYCIKYKGKTQENGFNRHNVAIFRKKA